ncbi:MAG TPA: STAS domain-containing protein [Amycolatopsis sp.]|uniref:STAS domain-containing protein n=1 Tax=Amycolatopsis sp. TaxID=37632 RepID=UPI002B4A894F|nr:STAS domain-containing protein [Amycolatopsis sp.]HKS45671.1 STAS domain-containing protein [Amycolatopsis sp.]
MVPERPVPVSIVEALLRLRVRRDGPDTTVSVHGEVDLLTAPRLLAVLTEQLHAATLLVVDVSEVDFFGAAGLDTLVEIAHRAGQRDVSLRLVAGAHVCRLLRLTGLDETLRIHDAVIETAGRR